MSIDFRYILKMNLLRLDKDSLFLYHNPTKYRVQDHDFGGIILMNDVMHYRDIDKTDTELGRAWAKATIKLK